MRKIALGLILVSQAVWAQPAPSAPAAGPTPAAPNAIDLRVQQRPNVSPQEMLAQSSDYRKRMLEVQARISRLVDEARKQKDIIRINCLTDKLVQVRANLNVADRAATNLQDAVARRDDGASLHEYTRVTIVNQNVQVLGSEGEACVGEDLSFVGATRVDVEVEGVPPGDPTQPEDPTPPSDTDLRPPAASPST